MTNLTRRTALGALALAPFATRASAQTGAQTWPSGLIRIVVPFPAGGSVDAISRLVQPGLQQRLGVNFIIENRPGASGSAGTALVAKSPPDGNNWVFVFDTHAVNPTLLPNMPFDTEKDLEPVLWIGTAPHVICTHPSRAYKSFADLLADAKARPGRISYASIGAGSLGHLTMVLLSKRAGVELTHVPYRGGGPALNDAIAGHVDLIIASTALVAPQIKAGGLRPILQTGETRANSLADLPTAIEAGFADFVSNAWWGVFAPARTPKAIIDRFSNDLKATLLDERVATQLREAQQMNLDPRGPDELRKFLSEQTRIWGAVVRENNVKAESG